MTPYSPIPRIVRGTGHHQLIHRILRKDLPVNTQCIDLVTTSQKRMSVIDSGQNPIDRIAEGDTCVHVLWQEHEADAALWIDNDHLPIAPGDTAAIPAGDRWRMSPNTLVLVFVMRHRSLTLPIPPSHGTYQFAGHNRASQYPCIPGHEIHRWKLTMPLHLPQSDSERILVGLYANVAILDTDGISTLPQGECRVIRPETGQITLVPNGLAYVLVVD